MTHVLALLSTACSSERSYGVDDASAETTERSNDNLPALPEACEAATNVGGQVLYRADLASVCAAAVQRGIDCPKDRASLLSGIHTECIDGFAELMRGCGRDLISWYDGRDWLAWVFDTKTGRLIGLTVNLEDSVCGSGTYVGGTDPNACSETSESCRFCDDDPELGTRMCPNDVIAELPNAT